MQYFPFRITINSFFIGPLSTSEKHFEWASAWVQPNTQFDKEVNDKKFETYIWPV